MKINEIIKEQKLNEVGFLGKIIGSLQGKLDNIQNSKLKKDFEYQKQLEYANQASQQMTDNFIRWYRNLPLDSNNKKQPVSLALFEQYLLSSGISKKLLVVIGKQWLANKNITKNLKNARETVSVSQQDITDYFKMVAEYIVKDSQGMFSKAGVSLQHQVDNERNRFGRDEDDENPDDVMSSEYTQRRQTNNNKKKKNTSTTNPKQIQIPTNTISASNHLSQQSLGLLYTFGKDNTDFKEVPKQVGVEASKLVIDLLKKGIIKI